MKVGDSVKHKFRNYYQKGTIISIEDGCNGLIEVTFLDGFYGGKENTKFPHQDLVKVEPKICLPEKSVLFFSSNLPTSNKIKYLNIWAEIKYYVSEFNSVYELIDYLKEYHNLDTKNKKYCLECYTPEGEYVFCIDTNQI
jgi:hypothetical protein